MSSDEWLEVDVWDWQGKIAVVRVLTLPGAEIVGLFDGNDPLPESICAASAGLGASTLEWKAAGDPRPIKARIKFLPQKKSIAESPIAAPLLSVLGGIVVAVIGAFVGYKTADMKGETEQLEEAAKATPECVGKANKAACLHVAIETLRRDNEKLTKATEEVAALNAQLASEHQDLQRIVDGSSGSVRAACERTPDCVGAVVSRLTDQRVRLAIAAGCPEDEKQDACVDGKVAVTRRRADELAVNGPPQSPP